MPTKPIAREEYLSAAAAEWDAQQRAYEEALPRHPQLGAYLAAHPVEGVTVVDRSDGLGPRALDWPEEMPHPDVDAWVAEQEAAQAAEAEATAKREADEAAANAEADAAREAERAELQAKIASVREGKASPETIADLLTRVLL